MLYAIEYSTNHKPKKFALAALLYLLMHFIAAAIIRAGGKK
jgi:hypothetical protein